MEALEIIYTHCVNRHTKNLNTDISVTLLEHFDTWSEVSFMDVDETTKLIELSKYVSEAVNFNVSILVLVELWHMWTSQRLDCPSCRVDLSWDEEFTNWMIHHIAEVAIYFYDLDIEISREKQIYKS